MTEVSSREPNTLSSQDVEFMSTWGSCLFVNRSDTNALNYLLT